MDTELSTKNQVTVAKCQQVLMLLFLDTKLTVKEACKLADISERQYRYWISKGETSIQNTRELIDNQQRELISEIAIAKGAMIRKMILKSKADDINVDDLAKIYRLLDEELEELQSIYQVRPGIENEAEAFLKEGPMIKKQKSRFASIDIKETESGLSIDFNQNPEIIDGEAKDD